MMSLCEDIILAINEWIEDYNISQRSFNDVESIPTEDITELGDKILRVVWGPTDAQIERDRDRGK